MFLTDLVLVLVISIILTGAFAIGFRKQGFRFGIIFFFLLLFLSTWAGGIWVPSVGPSILSVNFFSFLIVGFIVAMLLTAVLPPGDSEHIIKEKKGEVRVESCKIVTVDLLFLMLVVILTVLILVAYL
jgi:hypothetical protein